MCAPIDKVYQKGVSEKFRLPQSVHDTNRHTGVILGSGVQPEELTGDRMPASCDRQKTGIVGTHKYPWVRIFCGCRYNIFRRDCFPSMSSSISQSPQSDVPVHCGQRRSMPVAAGGGTARAGETLPWHSSPGEASAVMDRRGLPSQPEGEDLMWARSGAGAGAPEHYAVGNRRSGVARATAIE